MTTLANKFLNDWTSEYEKTEGAVSEPTFSNSCEYSDIKNIPFQKFDDNSIVIVYRDNTGKVNYEHFDSDEYLDEEWDMEWEVNGNSYVMQNVWL